MFTTLLPFTWLFWPGKKMQQGRELRFYNVISLVDVKHIQQNPVRWAQSGLCSQKVLLTQVDACIQELTWFRSELQQSAMKKMEVSWMKVGWSRMKMQNQRCQSTWEDQGIKGGVEQCFTTFHNNDSQQDVDVWPAFFRVCLCRKHSTTSSWNFHVMSLHFSKAWRSWHIPNLETFDSVLKWLQQIDANSIGGFASFRHSLKISMGFYGFFHRGRLPNFSLAPRFPTFELGSFKTASWKAV